VVGAVIDGCGDSLELGWREDLSDDSLRKFGFGPQERGCYTVDGKIGGDVFRVDQQTRRGNVAKEVPEDQEDVETEDGILLDLGNELVIECRYSGNG